MYMCVIFPISVLAATLFTAVPVNDLAYVRAVREKGGGGRVKSRVCYRDGRGFDSQRWNSPGC